MNRLSIIASIAVACLVAVLSYLAFMYMQQPSVCRDGILRPPRGVQNSVECPDARHTLVRDGDAWALQLPQHPKVRRSVNTGQIIVRLNTWYRRAHPLHTVMYDKEMAEGEVAEIEPIADTLRDTWHNALAMIPWPSWVIRPYMLVDMRARRVLLEAIRINGVDQVPTGPGIVTLLDPVQDAGEESPVCFQVFQREHPPIFRVRALAECRFVLALMCDLYKPVTECASP